MSPRSRAPAILGVCSLPGRHAPGPLTVEYHHVVPVAWQLFWQPSTPPFPGHDPDGRGMLWDARAIALCPTHHRNAHALIVQLMHKLVSEHRDGIPIIPVRRSHRAELTVAQLGLSRFLAVSGSLLALTAAGEWGQV